MPASSKRRQGSRSEPAREVGGNAPARERTRGQTGGASSSSGIVQRGPSGRDGAAGSAAPPGADSQETQDVRPQESQEELRQGTQDELRELEVQWDQYQYAGGPEPWRLNARCLARWEKKNAEGAGGRKASS